VTTFTEALYVVSRLVMSPNVSPPAAQKLLSFMGFGGLWWGGLGHYVVNPS
jgi:hypothetical protein